MLRSVFAAFCLCVGVQAEDLVSMLQTNRLNIDKTSTLQLVTVNVVTCDTSHAESNGKFTIQFDGDSHEYLLHKTNDFQRAGTDNFQLDVSSGADVSNYVVKAHGTDGWCASGIAVNGISCPTLGSVPGISWGDGHQWFDAPCDAPYRETFFPTPPAEPKFMMTLACLTSHRCSSITATTTTTTTLPRQEATVRVMTCDTSHAQSNGLFTIQFDGDSHEFPLAHTQEFRLYNAANFQRFHLSAGADMSHFVVKAHGSDGWCASSITVNGINCLSGSQWFDAPCDFPVYNPGYACHTSFRCSLPEYDLNGGNACKFGYNVIRTKDDCINAAKVVKWEGELGVFMAKERVVTSRPTGCYMQTNAKQAHSHRRVIYNTHGTGAAHDQAMIICKKHVEPVQYTDGTITNAEYTTEKYESLEQAEVACNANADCKGLWQRTTGEWRPLYPGGRTWGEGVPNYTVKAVKVKG